MSKLTENENAAQKIVAAAQQQPQVPLDLSKATNITCDECGNYTFIQCFFLKHFSDITSPIGRAGDVPIPSFACGACGHVNNKLRPTGYRTEEKSTAPAPTPNDTKPNLKIER
jgi:hypothetical protein